MISGPTFTQRDGQKRQTRRRILDAALSLIDEVGEEQVTMGAVAARAGVRERTIYRYFETRDQLLQAAWRRIWFSTHRRRTHRKSPAPVRPL
jgi:AcrR family transcriptional regulator